jgi:hypothetical protein
VLGFPGSAEQRMAIERGEVTGDCGSWSSIPPDWITNKRIVPLVKFSTYAVDNLPQATPYIGDLIKDSEKRALVQLVLASGELGKPYIVSKKVPSDRIAILRSAFNATMSDAEFLASAKKLSLFVSPLTGEQAEDVIRNIYSAPPEIVRQSLQFLE